MIPWPLKFIHLFLVNHWLHSNILTLIRPIDQLCEIAHLCGTLIFEKTSQNIFAMIFNICNEQNITQNNISVDNKQSKVLKIFWDVFSNVRFRMYAENWRRIANATQESCLSKLLLFTNYGRVFSLLRTLIWIFIAVLALIFGWCLHN